MPYGCILIRDFVNGLSENWLIKECGDRHWKAVCVELKISSEKIVDSKNSRLYASFLVVNISGSPLSHFGESDRLQFKLGLQRLSKYRFFSEQSITTGTAKTQVQMVTIFIKKPVFDNNQLLEKGHPVKVLKYTNQIDEDSYGYELVRKWKKTREVVDHLDINDGYKYEICPLTDFNGARLLYFANYQAIMDRAEWKLGNQEEIKFSSTTKRSMYYFGNTNLSSSLDIFILNKKYRDNYVEFNTLMKRDDGKAIAYSNVRKVVEVPS